MTTRRFPSTILFTDIVGSTERAVDLGDHRWRELLERHHEHVRREIRRYGGEEIDTAGDGFLVLFDTPARALACADAIRRTVGELDIRVRCGVHFGEIERSGDDVGGIAVHTASRIAALAGPGEVLASSTVRDAEAGTGFGFEDHGVHDLKGIPGEWRIYALQKVPPDLEAALAQREPEPDLWTRIRRSRFLRVLLIYAAGSWLVLQTTQMSILSVGMPGWTMLAAAILLLIGLVVILATAWVQSHPLTAQREAMGEVPPGGAIDLGGIRADIARGRLPHLTWARALAGGVFAFALLFGIAGLYVVIQDRGRSFTPADAMADSKAAPGIAVLPFSVRGPEMEVWREGMVDLLSTGLDGAAGLRAIDSRTVLARWGERAASSTEADLATALEVARQTGARYALVGSAVATGANLRLVADVYRLEDGRSMGQARAEGAADSVLTIADRLAVEVLKVILPRESDLPRIDLARVTTASFPALKAYLEGEILRRRGDFSAAIEAYERAIAADSTFALAYYRLSNAYGWEESLGSAASVAAIDRAARLADRLPEREALLVHADRAMTHLLLDGLEPLREAVERYPDDAEAWYQLGETYFHLNDKALTDITESETAFRRAVALEPRFAPYRIHLVEMAFSIHADSAMASREIADYGRVAPDSRRYRSFRWAFALAFGDSASRTWARAVLDTMDLDAIDRTALVHPRFSAEMETISNEILERSTDPVRRAQEASGKGFRDAIWNGRWHEMRDLLLAPQTPSVARGCGLLRLMIQGFPVEPKVLEASLAIGEADTTPAFLTFCKTFYAADRGRSEDVTKGLAIGRREGEALLAGGDSLSARSLRGMVRLIEGYSFWKRGRRDEGLRLMQEAHPETNPAVNLLLGKLLIEAGLPEEAERYLRTITTEPIARYHLAKIYESQERWVEARAAYEEFATYWRDADPDMQPLVVDARQAAIRLRGLERE